MFYGRARQAGTIRQTLGWVLDMCRAQWLTCFPGSRICHLEELTEAAPLCWLSWHSVNKGLNILDKQRTNMPFPTASRKKRVTGLQACSDSMMLSFFSLVRLGFSHAQWNKWFRWEECSWKEPCTHRYLYSLECKGASHCVAQCSQCPDVVPV